MRCFGGSASFRRRRRRRRCSHKHTVTVEISFALSVSFLVRRLFYSVDVSTAAVMCVSPARTSN